TPAQHTLLRPIDLTSRAVGRRAFERITPRIGAPLPHVAVHVVEAPRVRLLLADGRIVALRVAGEPRVFTDVLRIVAEGIARLGPGAAGVFPLGLPRQANDLIRTDQLAFLQLLRHLAAELVRLVPAHHLDRVAHALPLARILADHRLVQLLRYLVASELEWFLQRHLQRRLLARRAVLGTHRERGGEL